MNGILMRPWKVKFIAESDTNTELQTRRAIKELNKEPDDWIFKGVLKDGKYWFQHPQKEHDYLYNDYLKPRYHVGQVVYIKEAWRYFAGKEYEYQQDIRDVFYKLTEPNCDRKWNSPLFMPQWAARYFIQITGVRPKRLQEITPEDVEAEGTRVWLHNQKDVLDDCPLSAKQVYARLWDSINGEGDYALNKWVWRYEFTRSEPVETKRVGSNG